MKIEIKKQIKKLYSTGALHITMGTFMTKFVAFFGSIVVVRLLTKEEYGLISYIENIYSYTLIFAGFGLSYAILRYLVLVDSEKGKKQYFNYITYQSIIRNVFLLIILCVISQMPIFPDNYKEIKIWLPVLAFLLPFQDLVNDDLFTFRAFFRNKLYAYASFLISSLLILGRILGAYIAGVGGVFGSQVIINFICGTIGYIFIKRKLLMREKVGKLSKKNAQEVTVYSLQYMITNGLWAIFMLNDTFLLGVLLNNPIQLAEYKVAYVFPGNLAIFATAIGVFIAPHFTKNENNREWIKSNYKKVFMVTAIIVGMVALFIGAFAEPIVMIVYGKQYSNIVNLMRVLLLSAFMNSGLRYTTANLLSAMGEVKYNMVVSFVGIIIQIILDILLIPLMGTMAVAISNCIVHFFMAFVLFTVFIKKYYL